MIQKCITKLSKIRKKKVFLLLLSGLSCTAVVVAVPCDSVQNTRSDIHTADEHRDLCYMKPAE